jgi:hypothetical protein
MAHLSKARAMADRHVRMKRSVFKDAPVRIDFRRNGSMQGFDPAKDSASDLSHVPPARPTNLRGLVALNIVLLMVLAAVTFGASVHAQNARGRGEYTMVSGGVNGSNSAAVWIVDVANQEMIALTFTQQPNRQIEGIGYRNLAADAASLTRARNRPAN